MKKIANVVFYKFYGESGEREQACIFYNDGTVLNCSYDDGLDAAYLLLKAEGVSSKDLKDVINNKHVHVMSGYDFEKNFQNFIVNEKVEDNVVEEKQPVVEEAKEEEPAFINLGEDNKKVESSAEEVAADTEVENKKEKQEEKVVPIIDTSDYKPSYEDLAATDYEPEENDTKKKEEINKKPLTGSSNTPDNGEVLKAANEAKAPKNTKKKKGFFSKVRNFFHRAKVRAGAAALAVVLALGGGFLLGKGEGKIAKFFNNTISKIKSNTNGTKDAHLVYGDNDYYNDYTYSQLLKVNTNEAQKGAMKNIHYAFTKYNRVFANSHLEEGKDVKAALSWTEMNALQQAYNNYSNEDIVAIFNGTTVDANKFSQAYRNANLQLMGAHVIETRENPVDMSMLLNTEEAKNFYNKYHEAFLQIKEATGQDKIDKVNAWRQSLLEDLPIDDYTREVGISHADNRIVENYKLSIIPMASAVEIMYQNLATDNTLSQKTIDYLNDTGLCNLADDKFEKLERLTEVAVENNAEPLYEQYKYAMVSELEAENNYVVDDAHRDLSQLDAFQKAVNEHNHGGIESGSYSSGVVETYTTTEIETHTETKVDKKKKKTKTSDRDKAVELAGEDKVKQAEDDVDKQIQKENDDAKQKAEDEAEQNRQNLQDEADKHAQEIQDEIAKEESDLQQDINDANDQINQNNADNDTSNDKPVNEKDFGDHNVDFDDNHSDSNGNLDNSVKDVTTDGTGDQSNEPLPDPNATGQVFESTTPEAPVDQFVQADPVPAAPSEQADTVIEYEEPVDTISNEELAEMIVEDMANNPDAVEEGYQYVLQ